MNLFSIYQGIQGTNSMYGVLDLDTQSGYDCRGEFLERRSGSWFWYVLVLVLSLGSCSLYYSEYQKIEEYEVRSTCTVKVLGTCTVREYTFLVRVLVQVRDTYRLDRVL